MLGFLCSVKRYGFGLKPTAQLWVLIGEANWALFMSPHCDPIGINWAISRVLGFELEVFIHCSKFFFFINYLKLILHVYDDEARSKCIFII